MGSENFQIRKEVTGELILTSEGVITPPIPIPFVKPKIKFEQTITVGEGLRPLSLSLQYRGPLGIGNRKISAYVEDDLLTFSEGKREETIELDSESAVFLGTSSSQALFSIILARRKDVAKFTEIRSGGSGPPREDEGIVGNLLLKSRGEREISIEGKKELVDRFTFREGENDREKTIIAKEGTFLASIIRDGEDEFYVYREDLLGVDFRP